MKILTLCEKCRQLLSESYDVRPYIVNNSTTKSQQKCENCRKLRRDMKMYTINKKGR